MTLCSPELSQCWISNVLTQATAKNQTDTHWPPHRQPRTRVRFIDGPDALWAHTCSHNCVTGKFQETMKNHASKCLLVKRCANFDEQRSMLIHHDQSIPNLVSSNYLKFRNFQENTKKFFSLDYQHAASTWLSRDNGTRFTMKMSCPPWPAPIIICCGNFQESFRKRASHNRSSLQIRDATRVN